MRVRQKVKRACSTCGKLRLVREWRRPVPSWFAAVRRGDTVLAPCGQRRVLRVTRRKDGSLAAITFQKLRPSQYNRPTTVYTPSDLLTIGYRYLGRAASRGAQPSAKHPAKASLELSASPVGTADG